MTTRIKIKDGRPSDFFRVGNDIVDSEQLDAYAGWVYTVLCRYTSVQDDTCYPSLNTLCKKTKMSKPKLIQCIAQLEEIGLLGVERRKNEGDKNEVNIYTVYGFNQVGVVNDVNHPSKPHLPPLVNDVYPNNTQLIKTQEQSLSPATQDDSAATLPTSGTGSSESVTPATVKKTKRLHTAAIKNELLPILIKYGKGRAMDSYTPSELTTLMRTGMAQILTELQPLDDESPIDAMELDAAFKWFRKQYKDASYPCGSKTVVKMLADYRAYKRSLQVAKPHIPTPALDGLLAQPAPTYADSIDITDVRMMGETK